MEKFKIWKAKDPSFTKTFGQSIRFIPYDMIATSDHTVTDIQVAVFRGCLLLRLTDYLFDPNDESVRKILNVSYQKIDSAIAYQDTDGKVKIASEGYNNKYIGDAVEAKQIELDWFDFASSEFTTKDITDQEDDSESSNEMEEEVDIKPEEVVDEKTVDSDDENQETDEKTETIENDTVEEESDDSETDEELASSIENESEDEKEIKDANSDVQHEPDENEDMTEVENWSKDNEDLHDDEKEEKTLKAFVETDNSSDNNEEKAATVAAKKYRLKLNQEPRPNKNKKNFKQKKYSNNSNRPVNKKQSTTIPLHNPVNRNSELLKKLMGI